MSLHGQSRWLCKTLLLGPSPAWRLLDSYSLHSHSRTTHSAAPTLPFVSSDTKLTLKEDRCPNEFLCISRERASLCFVCYLKTMKVCPETRNELRGMVPGDQGFGAGCTGEASLGAPGIA